MELIVKESELVNNIETVESYLAEDDAYINGEVLKLVKRGTCFVAYTINSEIRFAPSRFLGYKNNKLDKRKRNRGHGNHTNRVISKILGTQPLPSKKLEKLYLAYCNNLGIKPSISGAFGAERKFWSINIAEDFAENLDLTGEFPEGKIVERKHKARERNAAVILIAKENFKKKYGKLFCQACEFDFEQAYGDVGKDFIEGHHIIPVSEMEPDHKTKAEEIALVCANCHRMIHKKRPWLKMSELKGIVKRNKI